MVPNVTLPMKHYCFCKRIITKGLCPPGSPELMPLVFFLLDYVKGKLFIIIGYTLRLN